jgi:hypothetical protein
MIIQEKHHKIICAGLALAFLVVLQSFAAPAPVFRYLIPAFLIYFVVVGAYNFFYLRASGKFNQWMWIRTMLFFLAWFGLFLIPPTVFLRGAFLLVSLPIIYFVELAVANVGENILFNLVILTAFSFYMAIAAAGGNYFTKAPAIIFISAVCLFTLLLTRSSFELIPVSFRTKWLYSLIISLFITEIFWAISFLPLHFSALGFFLLDVFYFLWTLCYYFLLNNLTVKKIQFHSVLLIVIIIVIMIATPWTILV